MTAAPLSRLPGAWDARLIGIVACSLLAFGIAAVYGASSIAAVQAGRVGSWFALRQLIGGVLGVGGLLIAARVDYHVWQRLAWPLLGGALVLLLVPYMPGTGAIAPEINGARRWVDVGVVIVQPSEIAKFAAVVWVSMLATKKGAQIRDLRHGLLPFIVIVLPTVLLIVFEPDLSTAALLVLIVGIVLFTAGARVGHFLVIGLIGVPVVWREIQGAQYQLTRVLTFLSPGLTLPIRAGRSRSRCWGSVRAAGLELDSARDCRNSVTSPMRTRTSSSARSARNGDSSGAVWWFCYSPSTSELGCGSRVPLQTGSACCWRRD